MATKLLVDHVKIKIIFLIAFLGIHLINHIDEGLYILKIFNASELAKRAYILHPLVQGDADLANFWKNDDLMQQVDKKYYFTF
jgi:hypothetical protein